MRREELPGMESGVTAERRQMAADVLQGIQEALDDLESRDVKRWDRAIEALSKFQSILVYMENQVINLALSDAVHVLADEIAARAELAHMTGGAQGSQAAQ
jgi:hypothetical protein